MSYWYNNGITVNIMISKLDNADSKKDIKIGKIEGDEILVIIIQLQLQ